MSRSKSQENLRLQSGPVLVVCGVKIAFCTTFDRHTVSSREATSPDCVASKLCDLSCRIDPILVSSTLRFDAKILGSVDLFCQVPCQYFLLALNLRRQFARIHSQWWLPAALPITAFLSIMEVIDCSYNHLK